MSGPPPLDDWAGCLAVILSTIIAAALGAASLWVVWTVFKFLVRLAGG